MNPIDDPLEDDIQIQIVEYLTLLASAGSFIFFHVPNQAMGKATGRGGLARMARLKRMGLRPGVADLVLVKGGKTYFLEVKRLKGKQSVNQMEFEVDALRSGTEYAVAHSFDEAKKILQNWHFTA